MMTGVKRALKEQVTPGKFGLFSGESSKQKLDIQKSLIML